MLASLTTDWPLVSSHHGCPLKRAPRDGWRALGEALIDGTLELSGLWGYCDAIRAALFDPNSRDFAVVAHEVVEQRFRQAEVVDGARRADQIGERGHLACIGRPMTRLDDFGDGRADEGPFDPTRCLWSLGGGCHRLRLTSGR